MSPLILVTVCLLFVNLGETLQCMDENNQEVDWYVMYKINAMSLSSLPEVRAGNSYIYITSATLGNGWQLTSKGVDSSTSMLANTLAPLYNRVSVANSSTVLYNDSPPGGLTRGDKGHAKGVLMANADTGFWLVHSVPSFPDIVSGVYSFPNTGKKNAQSFLCISINSDQVETIARQFQFNEIIPYYSYSKPSLKLLFPTLGSRKYIKNPPYNNKATISTSAGVQFTSFAKSTNWRQDLYKWVANQLGSTLLVQTWRNGLPNDCKGHHVVNIKSVVIRVNNLLFGIMNGQDHSKWAISNSNRGSGGNWVCIGDINRADTQFDRGGGTVCVNLPDLWEAYSHLANENEACPHVLP